MNLSRARCLMLLTVGALMLAAVAVCPPAAQARGNKPKHPLHDALHELREAKREMEKAKHDYGGHKKVALEAVDHAIEHLDKLLGWVKEHKKEELEQEFKDEKQAEVKGEKHPHIHAAIHELKRAGKYVKDSKHDFGDNNLKEESLKSIHHAIEELEKALKAADEKK